MESKKTKRSHHAVNSSRPNRVEIMLTDEELKIIDYRLGLVKNGQYKSRSSYIRDMALNGEIYQAVTAQDRKDISRLVNIGTNLWNLRKQAHEVGLLNMEIAFKNFAESFERIIEYYQEKLSNI